MRLMVTGGAGYIGSHVVRQLSAAGHAVVVYDNLSAGHRDAVLDAELVVGDLADTPRLDGVLARGFDAVLHFAASLDVAESMREPLAYFTNNTANSLRLFNACRRHGVGQVVCSSTAAVYGEPEQTPIPEDAPTRPVNPYGQSKLMTEQALRETARTGQLRHVILRYFNAAGASPDARIGEAHEPETHLIPLALQVAAGQRAELMLYGTDYPTPDGSCLRDYIHVEDLASAHLAALDHLTAGGESLTLNCGYGHGYSVREVIAAVERVTGRRLPVREMPRRPGDAAELVAAVGRIRERLGWTPRHDDLDRIVADAWRWEQARR